VPAATAATSQAPFRAESALTGGMVVRSSIKHRGARESQLELPVVDEELLRGLLGELEPELLQQVGDVSRLVRVLFAEADTDSDGYIRCSEMKGVFLRAGEGAVAEVDQFVSAEELETDESRIDMKRFIQVFVHLVLKGQRDQVGEVRMNRAPHGTGPLAQLGGARESVMARTTGIGRRDDVRESDKERKSTMDQMSLFKRPSATAASARAAAKSLPAARSPWHTSVPPLHTTMLQTAESASGTPTGSRASQALSPHQGIASPRRALGTLGGLAIVASAGLGAADDQQVQEAAERALPDAGESRKSLARRWGSRGPTSQASPQTPGRGAQRLYLAGSAA